MAKINLKLVILTFFYFSFVSAQFEFFEQMFGGQQHREQQDHEPQNGPSDSSLYQRNYAEVLCNKYVCPDTLACVDLPRHCPCSHPDFEDKIEIVEGKAICISKGGFKAGEAARKVELARKGLL